MHRSLEAASGCTDSAIITCRATVEDNRRLQGENADLRALLEVDMPLDFHTVPQMDMRAITFFSEACMQA